MAKEDEEKTAFITSQGIFCYSKMPFGLKNVGATYQRLVDKAFQKQIGRNLEVYVDDLVIKSRTEQEIMRDIEETKVISNGLRKLKKLIAELPTLTTPMETEELIVYLAATQEAVSALLMIEREARQMPIYFVSRALQGPEIKNHGETAKVKHRAEGYDIQYRPRTSVKGRILADFIVEHPEDDSPSWPDTYESGRNKIHLCSMRRSVIVGCRYSASIMACDEERDSMNIRRVLECESFIYSNSVNGSYTAKESGMVQYLEKVKALASNFKKYSIKQKSINEVEVLAIVEEEGDTWMTPIYNYLTEETLPVEKEKARAIRRKSGRFGLPGEIISNNGKQFMDNLFKDWCEKLCIRQRFASVKHPQANGLVERANRSLGEGIKARLDERSKD
ncbi:reverse transcriptase domain-containing protein [Tanacetum coccineum]